MMLDHLRRLYPAHYRVHFEEQALLLYTRSLTIYLRKQEKEIDRLYKLRSTLSSDDIPEKIASLKD